jgi:hypothetical protein
MKIQSQLVCSAGRLISKMLTGLIYLSFFLVQFDIHLSGSAQNISFFSSDYSSVNSVDQTNSLKHSGLGKESRQPNFKLNKRFHPQQLFTAPNLSMALVQMEFHCHSTPILTGRWPSNLLFNSPSRRGPPVVV